MSKKLVNDLNTLQYHKHYDPLLRYWNWCQQENQDMSGFCSFEDFFSWSVHCGYENGMILVRKNARLAFSPENCLWRKKEASTHSYNKALQESIARFDKTVARIRAAHGLPPLEPTKNSTQQQR